MKKEILVETLGSLIKAEPKEYDYENIADLLVRNIYSKIHNRDFSLKRSGEHDNNSPRNTVYTDNLLVSISPEEFGPKLFEVAKSFQDDNMDIKVLSKRVIEKIAKLDESDEGDNFFNDVVLVLGYTNETEDDVAYVDYLSKMDEPAADRAVQVNLSFILEEDKDTFLDKYNGDDNKILIGGKVKEFIFLDKGGKFD